VYETRSAAKPSKEKKRSLINGGIFLHGLIRGRGGAGGLNDNLPHLSFRFLFSLYKRVLGASDGWSVMPWKDQKLGFGSFLVSLILEVLSACLDAERKESCEWAPTIGARIDLQDISSV
jgi:hypothetical protein